MKSLSIFKRLSLTVTFLLPFYVSADSESHNVTPQIEYNIVSPGPHSLALAGNINDIFLLAANGSDNQTAPKSLFYKNSISFSALKKKTYKEQFSDYTAGDTPYFRGTYESVVQLASDVQNVPELKPVVIYQLNEPVGDMVLVVNSSIQHLSDLCGKEVFAPDTGYSTAMINVLIKSITCDDKPSINWSSSKEIIESLRNGKSVASFVSGYSLKKVNLSSTNYRILLDDTVAPEISGDVLAVRSDFYENRRYLVNKLVKGIEQSKLKIQTVASDDRYMEPLDRLSLSMSLLMTGDEGVAEIIREHLIQTSMDRNNLNVVLFDRGSSNYFVEKVDKANDALLNLGVINKPSKPGLGDMYDQLLSYDSEMQRDSRYPIKNKIADIRSSLFSFSVGYGIEQTDFSHNQYAVVYDKVAKLLEMFPGTSLVITGHADPINFIRALERNASLADLNMIKQVDKNHSLILAELVKASLLNHIELSANDTEQIQVFTRGKGISEPLSGGCRHGVCKPKSWSEWKSNLRVVIDVVPSKSSQFEVIEVSDEQ